MPLGRAAADPDPGSGKRPSASETAETTYRQLLFETFAFELRLGHRLGFVRAFASPRVAEVLHESGQIEHATSRRATDTGLFLYTLLYRGLDSADGRRAVERINEMHAAWPIRNEDYLWNLGNWFLPGIRIIDRYGWRPLQVDERQAIATWHRDLGQRLGVHDLPDSWEAFEAMTHDYERDAVRPSAAGRRLRAAALDVAVRSLPRPLRPLGAAAGISLLDTPVREALGLPAPGRTVRALTTATLRVRAARRRRRGPGAPWFVPGAARRDHPDGYTIENLGPADGGSP